MVEELITFETAKLAKEKGFDEITRSVYTPKGELDTGASDFWNSQRIYPNMKWAGASTQALLQRWLRDKHQTMIVINTYSVEDDIEQVEDEYWHYIVRVTTRESGPTHDVFVKDKYISYEDALEDGLKAGLLEIKI